MPEISRPIYSVPLKKIFADEEFNCRGKVAPCDVTTLAADILAKGKLLQAVVLKPISPADKLKRPECDYKLICGYRRYMAHRVLKWDNIDATIDTEISEEDADFMNLSENLQRCDLNILQEARAIRRHIDAGMNRETVGKKINQSPAWVQLRMMVLDFPDDVQEECAAGTITQTDIRKLYTALRKGGKDKMYDMLRFCKTQKEKGNNATERYEVLAKELNPNRKKIRTKPEMTAMMDVLINSPIGACFATRILAWCSGEICTNEVYTDIDNICEDTGREPFVRPAVRFRENPTLEAAAGLPVSDIVSETPDAQAAVLAGEPADASPDPDEPYPEGV